MLDALLAKILSILIIFGGSLLCGLLPAFKIFSTFPRFALSLILSFGGGILIATSLVHILPESRRAWPSTTFSAEMTLCLGIFLVYVVEEIAHFLVCHDLHSPLGHPGGGGDGHNHGVHMHHDEPPNRCEEPAAVFLFAEEKTRSGEHGQALNQNNTSGRCHSGHGGHGHSHNHSHSHGHEHGHGEGHPLTQTHSHSLAEQRTKLFPQPSTPTPQFISPLDSAKEDRKTVVARLRSLVGLIALSVHAGLEGLSVGLGQDGSEVMYLCFAVAAHKLVIAFCLGMEVRNASANTCSLVVTSSSASFKVRYVLFFALMTPLGIAIGTGITELVATPEGGTQSGLVAVLQALASGTLLYVAFFEVILRERVRFSGKGLAQLGMVILGWTVMVGVEIALGPHNHDHDGQGHGGHGNESSHEGHGHEGHSHADEERNVSMSSTLSSLLTSTLPSILNTNTASNSTGDLLLI